MARTETNGHEHSDTPDPVLFGTDPFAGQPEQDWDEEAPAYSPRPKWPVVVTILIMVMLLVVGMGLWVI